MVAWGGGAFGGSGSTGGRGSQDNVAETANKDVFARDEGVATAVSIMYVTASPTFTGAIAGYTTVFASNQNTAVAAAVAAASTQQSQDESQQEDQQQSQDQSQQSVQQSQPSFDVATPQTQHDQTTTTSTKESSSKQRQKTSTKDTSNALQTSSSISSQLSDASSSTSASASQSLESATQSPTITKQKHGMSGGATAGIIIGLLLALALLAGAGYYWWRRRQAKGERLDDEKSFISPIPPAARPGRAPRLSLGPGIIPGFGNPAQQRPPMALNPSSGARVTIFPSPAAADAAMANPFGQQSEIAAANAPISTGPAVGAAAAAAGGLQPAASQRSNPFSDSNATPPPDSQVPSAPRDAGEPVTAAAVAGAVAAAAATQGRNGSGAPSNVHRVQLNFQPTMDDELELQAGQVVRIMHEYDDGWALCMRMDRSKQGVVPRTCLSKTPIKPRLTNPSGLQTGGQPRNFSVQQGRPSSPARTEDTDPSPQGYGRASNGWGPPKGRPRSASAGRQSQYPGTVAQSSPRTTYRQTARRSSSVGGWQGQDLDQISPDDSASLRGAKRPAGPGAAR